MADNADPSVRSQPFLNIAGKVKPKQDPDKTDNSGGSVMSEDTINIAGRNDQKRTTTSTTTPSTVRPTTRSPRPKTTTRKIETTTTTTTTVTPDDEENSGEGSYPGNDPEGQTSETCKPTSGQHGSYIKDNLDMLQKRCADFHACTVELYKSENFHRILVGDNIQLRNICGLLYPNASGRYKTLENQCSVDERDSIKQELEEELSDRLNDESTKDPPPKGSWEKLSNCLNKDSTSDEAKMDALCRIKGNSTRPLCNSTEVEKTAEDFVNLKLKELHCSCDSLTAESKQDKPISLGAVIGGTCSISVVLILIIIIVVLCIRHRRLKRRLTTESKRSGNMQLPLDDSCPIYQELGDPPQGPDGWSKWGNPGYRLAHRPPTLPYRYVPHQIPTAISPNDHEYLEPLPDFSHLQPGQTLPGVGGQGPGQYDLARQVEPSPDTARKTVANSIKERGPSQPPEEGTYFEKIDWQSVKDSEEDGGYSTLGRKPTLRVRGTPEVSGEELQPLNSQSAAGEEGEGEGRGPGRASGADPAYFVLEPTLSMTTQV